MSMTTANEVVSTSSAEETEAYALRFSKRLIGGEVLTLSGELGSGKTTFIRGLAQGLGSDPRSVSSPSYTIVNIYEGKLRLVHIDLYRLGDASEIEDLGLEDLFDESSIAAVEWGERLPTSLKINAHIGFEIIGDEERRITVETNCE